MSGLALMFLCFDGASMFYLPRNTRKTCERNKVENDE